VKRTGYLLLGWLLFGCDDPLKSVELVAEPRVLGARVEVTDDAGRAAPGPGESASVRFLVATNAPTTLGFQLSACPASPRRGARAACAAEPFAEIASGDGEVEVPSLSFEVPSDLDSSGRLLVQGTICPFGSVNDDGGCDGPDPGTPVQLELELAHDDDVNRNPELEPESIRFDEVEWLELTADDGDCEGLGLPEVEVKSKHAISVQLDEADRDQLPRASELDPSRESLQLSHFTTAGDLGRAFDSIAWDDDELGRQVSWTAPKDPGLVRLWIVLRDFRGGSAFVERAVCVH
jgi:hypothetical protein